MNWGPRRRQIWNEHQLSDTDGVERTGEQSQIRHHDEKPLAGKAVRLKLVVDRMNANAIGEEQ
jgi:hypothetical protein